MVRGESGSRFRRLPEAPLARLRIALGQYDTGWHDPRTSLARIAPLAEQASRAGARLLLLPEMCTTGFTMDRSFAEALDGPSARSLGETARNCELFVLAGMATRAEGREERYFNSAVLFAPDGSITAEYRKQRLFGLGGEPASYDAGQGTRIVEIDGVRLAPFICYDLRFPELFRAVAREIDVFALIANWPVRRRAHWDLLVQARAVENLCYMAAVNRIGEGGGAHYNGGSAAYGPWGELLASSGSGAAHPAIVEVDSAAVGRVRAEYPFLDDLEPAPVPDMGGGSGVL